MQVPHSGKKMIFTSRVNYVEGLADKYRKPKVQGGFEILGAIGVHANSHGGDAVARFADIELFKKVLLFGRVLLEVDFSKSHGQTARPF